MSLFIVMELTGRSDNMFGLNPIADQPFASSNQSRFYIVNLLTTVYNVYIRGSINNDPLNSGTLNGSSTISLSILIANATYLKLLTATITEVISIVEKANHVLVLIANTILTYISLSKLVLTTKTITTTTTTSLSKLINKYFSLVVTEVITALEKANHVLVLIANAISNTVSLTKQLPKTFTVAVSSVISLIKAIGKLLNTSSSITSTLAYAKFFYKVLSIVSTVTTILTKTGIKVLTIGVNSVIILVKSISKLFSIISNTSTSLVASAISFVNYAANKVIYAVPKLRSLAATRFITMVGTLKKVRSASLVKFRTLFIDKDLNI